MRPGDEGAGGRLLRTNQELSIGQMVRANRPYRLVRDLSKVLVATLASAGFFIINSNAWGIADQLTVPSLQSDDRALTQRANAATALTLLLGLLFSFRHLDGDRR